MSEKWKHARLHALFFDLIDPFIEFFRQIVAVEFVISFDRNIENERWIIRKQLNICSN